WVGDRRRRRTRAGMRRAVPSSPGDGGPATHFDSNACPPGSTTRKGRAASPEPPSGQTPIGARARPEVSLRRR
ncbi:MAG: hypothetical protein AVDCRST_MAG19-253, partial [uncultured Thermomicrobiales bacterium]